MGQVVDETNILGELLESLNELRIYLRTLCIKVGNVSSPENILKLSKVFPNMNRLIFYTMVTSVRNIIEGTLPAFKELVSLFIKDSDQNGIVPEDVKKGIVEHIVQNGRSLRVSC